MGDRHDILVRTLRLIAEDVVGRPLTGVHANFFELGATSAHLVELHQRVNDALGTDLPLVDVFTFPTLSALAERLGGAAPADASPALRERATRQREAAARFRERRKTG